MRRRPATQFWTALASPSWPMSPVLTRTKDAVLAASQEQIRAGEEDSSSGGEIEIFGVQRRIIRGRGANQED